MAICIRIASFPWGKYDNDPKFPPGGKMGSLPFFPPEKLAWGKNGNITPARAGTTCPPGHDFRWSRPGPLEETDDPGSQHGYKKPSID